MPWVTCHWKENSSILSEYELMHHIYIYNYIYMVSVYISTCIHIYIYMHIWIIWSTWHKEYTWKVTRVALRSIIINSYEFDWIMTRLQRTLLILLWFVLQFIGLPTPWISILENETWSSTCLHGWRLRLNHEVVPWSCSHWRLPCPPRPQNPHPHGGHRGRLWQTWKQFQWP